MSDSLRHAMIRCIYMTNAYLTLILQCHRLHLVPLVSSARVEKLNTGKWYKCATSHRKQPRLNILRRVRLWTTKRHIRVELNLPHFNDVSLSLSHPSDRLGTWLGPHPSCAPIHHSPSAIHDSIFSHAPPSPPPLEARLETHFRKHTICIIFPLKNSAENTTRRRQGQPQGRLKGPKQLPIYSIPWNSLPALAVFLRPLTAAACPRASIRSQCRGPGALWDRLSSFPSCGE